MYLSHFREISLGKPAPLLHLNAIMRHVEINYHHRKNSIFHVAFVESAGNYLVASVANDRSDVLITRSGTSPKTPRMTSLLAMKIEKDLKTERWSAHRSRHTSIKLT